MNLSLKRLTALLTITDEEMRRLRFRVFRSLGNLNSLKEIIVQHCESHAETICTACDNEPFCLVLLGIAYLGTADYVNGIRTMDQARYHFRKYNDDWNHIVASAILGYAYELTQNYHKAFLEYKYAHHQLTRIYLPRHSADYRQLRLGHVLEHALEIRRAKDFLPAMSKSETEQNNTSVETIVDANDDRLDYLALFGLPIYGTVKASPDGILHTQEIKASFTAVHSITIGDQRFSLKNVRGKSAHDHQITLRTGTKYGWALVKGLSMNAWTDYPLDPGDYVLFYQASDANDTDLVVASAQEPSGDHAPIVKRLDAKDGTLVSKSNDTSRRYDPIPLDENHKIFGVVIAVAKPIKDS
jgi:SOS-response transcriptional repressor LexA